VKKLLIAALILVVGWQYLQHKTDAGRFRPSPDWNQKFLDQPGGTPASARFVCDGRTHCSQMTSCEEARFFIQNCPGTEMDGDGDGIPCESQWCGH
jgi:hypothetical protein